MKEGKIESMRENYRAYFKLEISVLKMFKICYYFICLACMYVCVPCKCLLPEEVRKGL